MNSNMMPLSEFAFSKPCDSETLRHGKIQGILDRLASLDSSFQVFGVETSDYNVDMIQVSDGFDCVDKENRLDMLPSPMPYYDRNAARQPSQGSPTRSSSPASVRFNNARDCLNSKGMTQSMPNFESGRLHYNRRIGCSLALIAAQSRSRDTAHNRAAEFDVLLADL